MGIAGTNKDTEYSTREIRLLKHYNLWEIADRLFPPQLYEMMALEAFMRDEKGPYADSVRRCITALKHSKMYRMTPEWDAMIQLEQVYKVWIHPVIKNDYTTRDVFDAIHEGNNNINIDLIESMLDDANFQVSKDGPLGEPNDGHKFTTGEMEMVLAYINLSKQLSTILVG